MSAEEQPRRRLSGPSEEEEQKAAGRLIDILARIEDLVEVHPLMMDSRPKSWSELASDDTLTAPLDTSNLVTYVLNVAVDNIKAVRKLLVEGNDLMLYQVAQYPLLRSAIEASAEVIWLLEPNEQRERVRRLLAARASEFAHDKTLILQVAVERDGDTIEIRKARAQIRQNAVSTHKKNLKSLREVGTRAGLREEEYIDGVPPWTSIIEHASSFALASRPEAGVLFWRVASGFTHPSSSRSLMLALVDQDGEVDDGVITARVGASIQTVAGTAEVAMALLIRAETLAMRRLTTRVDAAD